MQQKTRDYFNRMPVADLTAHVAFRAIIRAVGRAGILKAYHIDLAIDADLLYRVKPTKFVYVLRDSGSHLWEKPDPTLSLQGILSCVGTDAKFYTYDEDRLEGYRDEPDLVEVTAEEMFTFLQQIGNDPTETRFLTAPECEKIAIRISTLHGTDAPLCAYMADMSRHAPALGQCLLIRLTPNEAREVDDVCSFLGIGQG